MGRKDFKKHNEAFVCGKCGATNTPSSKSERNHCHVCLFSLHVDGETPGDRLSDCHGFMEPISLDFRGNKGFMIVHRCRACDKEMRNRAAPDDEIAGRQFQ